LAFLLLGWSDGLSYFLQHQIHVSGAGDFQLQKIEILKDPNPLKLRKESDAMDSDDVIDVEVLAFTFKSRINNEIDRDLA